MGFWKTLSNFLTTKERTIDVEPKIEFKARIIDEDTVEYELLTGPDAGQKIRLMRGDVENRNANTSEPDFE